MPPPNPDHAPFIDSFPAVIPTPGGPRAGPLTQALVVAVLVVPWVMPFADKLSPAVWPWLTAAFCAALLFAVLAHSGFLARNAEVVARGWIVAASLSAVLGLVQYFGFSDQFVPWVSQTRPGEAFGNLRQRNQFASLMGVGLAALIWRPPGGSYRKYAPLLLVLLAVGNAASGSRTGLVQWLAILVLAFVWHGPVVPRARYRALFAFAAYLLWTLILPWLLVALTGHNANGLGARFGETPGCESRLVLWSNVLTLIADKPWFGWGWGELDYAHYMTMYPGERFCDILDNAHNLPMHLAVELGVPFALIVCSLLFWLFWRARPWRETDHVRQVAWAVLAVILLHSLLEYPLWYGPFQMAVGLSVYLLWVTGAGRDHAPAATVHTRRLLAGMAVLTICALAYAAWDYHRVRQIYLAPAQRDPAYRENTLEKIRDTRLFRQQFDFAALNLTPLSPANALETSALSNQLLHYSPEPKVIEKVIESAVMLRRDDEALLHLARYRAAFPQNHAKWRQSVVPTERVSD